MKAAKVYKVVEQGLRSLSTSLDTQLLAGMEAIDLSDAEMYGFRGAKRFGAATWSPEEFLHTVEIRLPFYKNFRFQMVDGSNGYDLGIFDPKILIRIKECFHYNEGVDTEISFQTSDSKAYLVVSLVED